MLIDNLKWIIDNDKKVVINNLIKDSTIKNHKLYDLWFFIVDVKKFLRNSFGKY